MSAFNNHWLINAAKVPSPNHNARPDGVQPELIVIHNISLPPGQFGGGWIQRLFTNCLPADADPYFQTIHQMQVSSHFLIDRKGVVTQFVGCDRRAWHAGQSEWKGRQNCNDFSIGIELEGTDDMPFEEAQYLALVELVGNLLASYPTLEASAITGHEHVAPGRKTDPGPFFDWPRLQQGIERLLSVSGEQA